MPKRRGVTWEEPISETTKAMLLSALDEAEIEFLAAKSDFDEKKAEHDYYQRRIAILQECAEKLQELESERERSRAPQND